MQPNFSYLNIYSGELTIYHFDLYRLKNSEDFLGMGFDEFLFSNGISCIEWSERIEDILPVDSIRIDIKATGENTREINIQSPRVLS
jgi:Predicted ATPase or kinase